MGGVYASIDNPQWVSVKERLRGAEIKYPLVQAPTLTVAQARSLAAQIMEAARRNEVRNKT